MQRSFPICTRETIESVLLEHNIRPWGRVEDPIPLPSYAKRDLTESELNEVHRFAPKVQVVKYTQPDNKPYTAFRVALPPFALTFTIVDDEEHGLLVLVVAEWKAGMEQIGLTFPAGVARDGESLHAAAMREFLEETGFSLSEIISLSRCDGIPVSGRNNTQRYQSFFGTIDTITPKKTARLDRSEFLTAILIPISEWIEMMYEKSSKNWIIECSSMTTSMLAFRELRSRGKLHSSII